MNVDSLNSVFSDFHQLKTDIKFPPPVIYLESVAGCPFSCAMCKPAATAPKRVPAEILERVEPAFKNLEVLAIHGQGEPLLADLEYFVNQSRKYDFVLHLDTNGLLLTDKIADLLLQTRLSIRFSIHAGRPETYFKLMGVDMEKVKANIRNLVEKSRHSPHSHDFWFSFIVMQENIAEVEDFLRLAHECGIQSVRFMHLWPNNDTLKGIKVRGMNFKYSEQSSRNVGFEFSLGLPRYRALARDLNINIEWGDAVNYDSSASRMMGELANKASHRLLHHWFFPLTPAKGLCAAPWLGQFTVTFNGDVLLCCLSSAVLGNLHKSSLEDIWQGPRMRSIRQAFHEGHFPHECGYCRGFGVSNYPHNSFEGVIKQQY
jgi:MoaA/NifB/PqqE/SkfB family radical SAM enzyme